MPKKRTAATRRRGNPRPVTEDEADAIVVLRRRAAGRRTVPFDKVMKRLGYAVDRRV